MWVFRSIWGELLNRASPDAFNLINIRSEAAAKERSLKKLLWKISQKFTRSFKKLFRITIQLVLSGEKKNRAWPAEYILAKAVVKRQSYYHLVLSSYQLAGLWWPRAAIVEKKTNNKQRKVVCVLEKFCT